MKQWQKADSKECKYFARKWGSGGGAFNSQTEKRIWDFESSLLQMQLELVFPGVSLAFPTAAVAAAAAVVFLPLCFN